MVLTTGLLFLLACTLIAGDSSSPEDYRITSLPLSKAMPSNPMYSGFFPVTPPGQEEQGQLFFWLIEANPMEPDSHTPLLVWLSGGPGTSSLEA